MNRSRADDDERRGYGPKTIDITVSLGDQPFEGGEMMKTMAFLTYNQVGQGNLPNGWHAENDRRAFLLQNSKGERWAVDQFFYADRANYGRNQHADHVASEIGDLWRQLQEQISEIDHVVVYVGSSGSERAIALAAQLPADRVTFVGCGCGLARKETMIQTAGMGASNRILCECGGHRTMGELLRSFVETGALESAVA